jgi:hypothetical protein
MDENKVGQGSQSAIESLIGELTRQRDELRLQVHLGTMEAKQQLGKLEDQLYDLTQRFAPTTQALNETSEDVWDALKLLGNEILEGFERVRKSL